MEDDADKGRAARDRKNELQLGRNIARRLAEFAAAVLRLSARLPKDPTGRHIAIQMVLSATGAGSNYEEA